jgi:hypothetical protein
MVGCVAHKFGTSGRWGITMLRYRLAFGLFAAAVLLFTTASAWAFSQQSVGPGGDGNSTFTDPDEQLTGPEQLTDSLKSVRPFDSNGPAMQFGVQQQGTLIPFGGGNGYTTSAPDAYYRPLRNGN